MAHTILIPPEHVVAEAEDICYKRSAKASIPDHDLDSDWPDETWVTLSHGYHLKLYTVDNVWHGTIFNTQTGSQPDSPQYSVFDHAIKAKEIELA